MWRIRSASEAIHIVERETGGPDFRRVMSKAESGSGRRVQWNLLRLTVLQDFMK